MSSSEGTMNVYAILVDTGHGYHNANVQAYVAANTLQQARMAFLATYSGVWYAVKATKVDEYDADKYHAPDYVSIIVDC